MTEFFWERTLSNQYKIWQDGMLNVDLEFSENYKLLVFSITGRHILIKLVVFPVDFTSVWRPNDFILTKTALKSISIIIGYPIDCVAIPRKSNRFIASKVESAVYWADSLLWKNVMDANEKIRMEPSRVKLADSSLFWLRLRTAERFLSLTRSKLVMICD